MFLSHRATDSGSSPLLTQLRGVERAFRVNEPLPGEKLLAMSLLKSGENSLFPAEESRCPVQKMLGAPAKILAYHLVEKLIGSFWALVENDLALREPGTVPLATTSREPLNVYFSAKQFHRLLRDTPTTQQTLLISELMKNTVLVWCESYAPRAQVLSMSATRLDTMIRRLSPGLEQNSPIILKSVSSALFAAMDSNQKFLVDVSSAIQSSLDIDEQKRQSMALNVLRDSSNLHISTFIALTIALSSMPPTQTFTVDSRRNLMIHEAMMCRLADELADMGRRTPRLGCPASRATATLRNGREVKVLGRYLSWIASVHEESARCIGE